MLHLDMKAFAPAKPPFKFLHVDTTWKFHEMIEFRDNRVKELGFDLVVHSNPEGIDMNISPFEHGSKVHTDIMKTQALKQALTQGGYDAVIGGARRDEEKSRAKERNSLFVTNNTDGIQKTKDQNFGMFTILPFKKVNQ
jgi:sulfate adenylyltransferase subunit 2